MLDLARAFRSTWCRGAVLVCVCSSAAAQEPLTLASAMQRAAEQTPAAAGDHATREAAEAQLDSARTKLWPELALSGGVTVGTGNVVAGGLFQPGGFPVVSGPPLAVELGASWQALGGVTARWDLLGLLGRVRDVDAVLAGVERVDALADARRLARAMNAGLAWLEAAEAAATVAVARADVERGRDLLGVAEALAAAGVRPGVERSLAAAELALAEQRLARTEGRAAATQARLAVVLGERAPSARVLGSPPRMPAGTASAEDAHPTVRATRSAVRETEARFEATRARFAPRLELAAAGWARAGRWPPGEPAEAAPNWAVGLVLELPLLDLATQVADARAARAERNVAHAQLENVQLEVIGQLAEAEALLEAARRADAQSAAVIRAARAAREQAEARFEAGLIDVTVVATAHARAFEAELAALAAQFDVLGTALARDYARGNLQGWMGLAR